MWGRMNVSWVVSLESPLRTKRSSRIITARQTWLHTDSNFVETQWWIMMDGLAYLLAASGEDSLHFPFLHGCMATHHGGGGWTSVAWSWLMSENLKAERSPSFCVSLARWGGVFAYTLPRVSS